MFQIRHLLWHHFLAVTIVSAGLLASTVSAASAQSLQRHAPGYEQEAGKLESGEPFQFTDQSYTFTAGVAYELLSKCNLSVETADRTEVVTFATAASQRILVGSMFSNPDLGKTLKSQRESQAIFAIGLQAAKLTECVGADRLITNIAKIVRSNKQGSDGGQAAFIKTCSPVHDEGRCGCLARLGSAVHSNIYQMNYSRELVYSIIQGNPLLGFQIMAVCSISRY